MAAFTTLLLPRAPYHLGFLRYVDVCLFDCWRRLASYTVTYSKDVDMDKQYILGEFPHGVRGCAMHILCA